MKKNFTKKLMAAAILLVTAVSPSWADYTITKSNGEPAVEGTDRWAQDGKDYVISGSCIYLKSSGLVLSGEINYAVYPEITDCTLTLKDATIATDYWAGSLCYLHERQTLVLEGTNRIVNTSTGSAICLYNSGKDITFTGSGELYMTSQAVLYDVAYQSSLYIRLGSGSTGSITADGFTIKGSTANAADISSLTDAVIDTYEYYDSYGDNKYNSVGILIGEDVCNTVWIKAVPAFDPDTEYVVVTYKEGSDPKKAYYKATDVEKIEWLKGEDITE